MSLDQAERALAAGRFVEAERLGLETLRTEPDNPLILLLVGITRVKTGRPNEAVPVLQQAQAKEITAGPASLWLSRAHRRLGNLEAALVTAQTAVARMPQEGPANYQLGIALQALGQNSAAIACFKQALTLSPNSPEILQSLFEALMDESETVEALPCARALLNNRPQDAQSHLRMARAFLANNNSSEAHTHLERAIQLAPNDGNLCFAAGKILESLGRIEEATAQFVRSIELLPEQGFAYSALAYNRKATESDRQIVGKMELLCERPELSVQAKTNLHYGLGKSLEDLGDYERAMTHFDEANRLSYQTKFGTRRFERQLYSERIDANLRRSQVEMPAGFGNSPRAPIFVVGMLRSGTTLVDQILSSHPEVGSAGEQGFWLNHRDLPLDPDQLKPFAAEYLRRLAEIAPDSRLIVDKMPDNYLELPLLHMAFPDAKIIHVQRNPADTCISIYTTINRLKVGWAHDKANIVFAYREYERVMDEWRKLLRSSTMLELRYEDLIGNQEQVTRELLAFCGLEWNDACLQPESTQRTVTTPSAWQVRQPLYRTSIDRWRRYEPWLGEFKALTP